MPSILNSLNIGYTGLSASQVAISTTGHNIANAESEGYTRQRVIIEASTPVTMGNGQIGNGVEVQNIARVFDNFVFDRYKEVSSSLDYSDYETQTLKELSSYFPEIDGVGVKADLAAFYDAWQNFADNPNSDAVKISLAKQTETLSQHINTTYEKVHTLQMEVNQQLEVNINQVNSLAKQLADLNKSIDTAEAGDMYTASDLRDKRNVLERDLSRLIGAKVHQGQLSADIGINGNANIRSGSYTLSVNGYNLVDGGTLHPLKISKDNNENGFYALSYERQDGTLIPLEEKINGGKIGAIFDLRGRTVNTTTGMPTDGTIQTTLSNLNAFAKGLIEATNNLYAQSATTQMKSKPLHLDPSEPLVNSGYNIKEGAFDIVMYDVDGKEIARRSIEIDNATTMSGGSGSNSIQEKMSVTQDDNGDGNANDDIDDYIAFGFQTAANGIQTLEFNLKTEAQSKGYTFSIVDKRTDSSFSSGTNFAGAFGMGRFFDGEDAEDISLTFSLKEDSSQMHAGYSSVTGDNRLALDMVQQQFENYNFQVGTNNYDSTLYGMFDTTATYVGINTNAAITRNETINTQFNTTQTEYYSISKVSVDEEMTNLIKYQTSYGAAAKVITTIDQMMQTLLGIKQ